MYIRDNRQIGGPSIYWYQTKYGENAMKSSQDLQYELISRMVSNKTEYPTQIAPLVSCVA